jgi:hypothetical protein
MYHMIQPPIEPMHIIFVMHQSKTRGTCARYENFTIWTIRLLATTSQVPKLPFRVEQRAPAWQPRDSERMSIESVIILE